jgi:hypothetical protein
MVQLSHSPPKPLLKHFSHQHILTDGLQIYRRLHADDQDSVRLLTIEDLIAIAQKMSPAEVQDHLLKQIRQSIGDKSWRVRYMAASHFNEVRLELFNVSTNLTNEGVSLLKQLGST